jgi:asparagine synthase (glutamine-hydrolysing)
MCGFAGYLDLHMARSVDEAILLNMMGTIVHRGPDSSGCFIDDGIGCGFQRLSIIDLDGGDQPLYNEDESLVLLCNGEIFNYRELREALLQRGHTFRTLSDVEVLLHLYEEEGIHFLNKLNGQFAFCLYDRKKRQLFLVRDQLGIIPLYYTIVEGWLIFASEIKAIIAHPLVPREVDLLGLDQILSFPGLVSPRTMFRGIKSVSNGQYISAHDAHMQVNEYWDLNYPGIGELSYARPEAEYIEQLLDLFAQSVSYRLQADVPVGLYLSGGLDSSLIAAMVRRLSPTAGRHTFSIAFPGQQMCEAKYQRLMAGLTESVHHELPCDTSLIQKTLPAAIYHSECPLKESYNTASLALSASARAHGIPVILTGEGSDELFAGYVGYRFDQYRRETQHYNLETLLEDELREHLWGDRALFYEKDYAAFRETKAALYSSAVNDRLEAGDCLSAGVINTSRVQGRHVLHQRAYLDFKLRLCDHLISDHGDRMAMAHSIEARYPFLDLRLVEFSTTLPPALKLKQSHEKYIVKKIAEGLVPSEIVNREKFGFVAHASPALLDGAWANDLLSYERIRRHGYFNPDTVEWLKKQYTRKGFQLNIPFDDDLLMIVLTFNLFLEIFHLPDLR